MDSTSVLIFLPPQRGYHNTGLQNLFHYHYNLDGQIYQPTRDVTTSAESQRVERIKRIQSIQTAKIRQICSRGYRKTFLPAQYTGACESVLAGYSRHFWRQPQYLVRRHSQAHIAGTIHRKSDPGDEVVHPTRVQEGQ
jgi:hypothetical protein